MFRPEAILLVAVAALAAAPAAGREACPERTLSLRFAPQAAGHWCWAASGQMAMELLGVRTAEACQCRQAEEVLGVAGCCAGPRSCLPADRAPASCAAPRWPAFAENPERYAFDYLTTCDSLPGRQDDERCDTKPLSWPGLSAEICAGRPVLATLHSPGSTTGHMVVVKGFSARPRPRVLVVDPAGLCPPGRDCEGELDEAFWLSYEEYAAGWDGRIHWVDFYGIRRASRPR
ncbi:MAG TPA: hypothetical protein VMT70_18630 [Vicinamibacteria bacterium]|nr:hypothetical protein [Vicinamibacteria bacterium]